MPGTPRRIEDYALIGDCQTTALVGKDGSIDWLCLPRFDSGACFAALLGKPEHGRWLLAPRAPDARMTRSYRAGTLLLDTTFDTPEGSVVVTDFMPMRDTHPHVIRVVRGVRGRVAMHTELVVRFDYGSVVPWVKKHGNGIHAIAGPNALHVASDVPLRGKDMTTVADFDVAAGQQVCFTMTWHPSHLHGHDANALEMMAKAETQWRTWSSRCTYGGEWRPQVLRSLITLKALTHSPTGGIVAAATTSLPEALGGVRNWDYRYCWARDATFTLLAMIRNGYLDEARAWREWLLRAVAGDPSKLQIMYAVDGARRLTEQTLPWLPGFEESAPVRIGNGAYEQTQLDVYGEIMDALYQCHRRGLEADSDSWSLRRKLLDFLETRWDSPDEGIWEVRGPRRQFTHSKVMAWVAFDRGIRRLETIGASLGDPALLQRWRGVREHIHDEVCARGYDASLGSFVQSYGSTRLDASLLMIPLVGFLPPDDERVVGTVRAAERDLFQGGFVKRYASDPAVDGLPSGEGSFLPCSFWLADNWALMGRESDARRLFMRLLGLCNDVGLLSEEYDDVGGRLLGNFPQAFSHVSLINTACNLQGQPQQRQP